MFVRRIDFKRNTTYIPLGGKVISYRTVVEWKGSHWTIRKRNTKNSQSLFSRVSIDFNGGVEIEIETLQYIFAIWTCF